MPRIIGPNYKNYNCQSYKLNRFNHRKALAIFLIGQSVTGIVWGAPTSISGSATTTVVALSGVLNPPPPYMITSGTGGSFNSNNTTNETTVDTSAALFAPGPDNTLGNYTFNLLLDHASTAPFPIINMTLAKAAGTININHGQVGMTSRVYRASGPDVNHLQIVNGLTAIDFTGATAQLHLVQNGDSTIYGNILGSNSGDTITLNGGAIDGNVVFGSGANTFTINGAAQLRANGVAITGGTSANTISINGTSTVSAGNGYNAITTSNISTGSTTIAISGTPTINGGIILGDSSGDTVTLTGGTVNGNIVLGSGANIFTISGTSKVDATTGAAITGGIGGNTINISGTSQIIAQDGSNAINIPTITSSSGSSSTPVISTITIVGTPTITGGINVPAVNNVLNIGTNHTAATYTTTGDITNMQTINLNAPIGSVTSFNINNNVTGVANFVAPYNSIITITGGSLVGVVASSGSSSSSTSTKPTLTNNGTLSVNAIGNIAGFSIVNNGPMTINDSEVIFNTSFSNAGNLTISNNGDLSALNVNQDTLTNIVGKTITVAQGATLGQAGVLGPVTNNGIFIANGDVGIDSVTNGTSGNIAVNTGGIFSAIASGTGSATGTIVNNGILTVQSGATVNASSINQSGTMTTAGTINAPINFGNTGITLNILGGTTQAIIGGSGADILNITGPFATNANISSIETINLVANNLTINNQLSGVATKFTTALGTTVNIADNGDISGGGSINNLGTISLSKTATGGTIGATSAMGAVNNSGTIIASGGNVSVGTITNNLAGAEFNVISGNIAVNGLINTLGSVEIQGGDVSTSTLASGSGSTPANYGLLNNGTNQTITVSKTGTIGVISPFSTVTNSGIINVQDAAVVNIGTFTNNSVISNNNTPVALNITGGQVLAGNIANTIGTITIGSTEEHSGDLSSANSGSLSTLVNNPYQTITVSGTGTIGNTTELGAVTNNGIINANGGNIIVGTFNNGDSTHNYTGSLNVSKGIVRVGNISNNVGTISIFNTVDDLGNIYPGDLSSAAPGAPSSLTNAANQIITVATGTIGANSPLGAVTNNGTMNIDNNMTIGTFTNAAATANLNLTGGITRAGNITNTLGNIVIGNNGGQIADLSSVNSLNPSTLTNAALQTITVMGAGTIGANSPLGAVTNSGTINAIGGNITIGNFYSSVANAAFNITSGEIRIGNIFNTVGSITIAGGDLSSVNPDNHSTLNNGGGQTITVSGGGTIGGLINSAIGTVTNGGIFQAYGGNITVDSFINGTAGNIGSLDIESGVMRVGSISNTSGTITIESGDLSGIVANANTLTNAAHQIITTSGTGTIGANYQFGTVNNSGTINAGGGNVKIGNFINAATGSLLNIINSNVQTGNINNNLGTITISGGDLSSVNPTVPSVLTNPTNQDITISGSGTVGANNYLGAIINDGTITATTNIFKAGTLNNTTNGTFNIINNNIVGSTNGIVLNGVNNSGNFSVHNASIIPISIGKLNNLAGGNINIYGPVTATGNFINSVGATTNIGANFDIGAGNVFTNNGTVTMLTAATMPHGGYTLGTTGTHVMTIDNGMARTLTLANGTASLANGSTININATGNQLLQDKEQFTIIAGSHAPNVPVNISNVNITGATGLVSYTLGVLPTSPNNITLTVNRQSIASIVDGINTTNSIIGTPASILDNLINNNITDPTLMTVLANLEKLGSQGAIIDAVNQLSPETDIAAITLATNGFAVPDAIAQRTELVARAGINNLQTGYAAGGMQIDDGLWIKGLGGTIEQKQLNGFAGYNANTVGVAFGADTKIVANTWFGLGLSSVGTHMKSKDYPAKKTNVSSYQVTVYGSYSPENYYVDLYGAMAFNNYTTARTIQAANQIATANFRGVQPSAKISTGYVHNVNSFRVIPNVSLQSSVLYQNPYSETGANGVGLQKVSSTTLSQLEAGVGIKLSVLDNEDSDQVYNPDIHFMVLHDFKASAQETTAQFIGGGGSFTVQSATPDKTTYNVGAGVVFMHKNRLHFTANYELRKKSKFVGHSGSLAVRYEL